MGQVTSPETLPNENLTGKKIGENKRGVFTSQGFKKIDRRRPIADKKDEYAALASKK